MARLKNLQAGGPHMLKLKGSNVVTARNVMVGEVWLCSGQSNMGRALVLPQQVQPRKDYWEAAACSSQVNRLQRRFTYALAGTVCRT